MARRLRQDTGLISRDAALAHVLQRLSDLPPGATG